MSISKPLPRVFRTLAALMFIFLATGCQTEGIYVPVFGAGESASARGVYIVRRGDTLYSIAFRYGLDYKALARANDIPPPYTIYVDQRLRLTERVVATSDGPPPAKTPAPSSVPRRPPVKSPGTGTTVSAPQVADTEIIWQWPYDGEVVGHFSLTGKVNKGINIRGKPGDPVRSTADGIVVYAGGGLRGYGKLVIVKHNDRYLSAYGHNESILVKEGQKVKRGQVVGRSGGGSGDSDLLHFEIRVDGKPRDPMQFLPTRG